ncbi:hypothetical protein Tco_1077063, partial [Tanacetum coccineum]
MANLKFADTHNLVAFLSKPEESDGFEQIVDFLNANPIKHALTVNPTIYTSCIEQFWATVKVKTVNGEVQLHALVDGKKIIINESTVRRDLQLEELMTTAWNEFSSTMASAIICLATNQKFNFSKYIFESMVKNLDNVSGKFLMYPRELTRMDTKIPQSSGPTEHVADKAVHKEKGDSLVRAATTASSLEAEQDSGNITKTRSKATLNEPSSSETSSGSGPKCQETMGDTIAQTRFENVFTQSYDPLLVRGNRLRSGKDSLKLKELMELCTNLQQRVLDLEKTKTTQAKEIVSLKRRVKKLEQKKRSRTHKQKRLRKVGATARVESSDDESLGKDASKQGRIDAIDAYDDITLVSAVGNKVSTAGAATTVSLATTTTATTINEITLAQALQELKSTKPKGKIQSQDKGKGIMIEEPVNKLSNKDQLKLDEEIALKLQAEIDEEERIASAEE